MHNFYCYKSFIGLIPYCSKTELLNQQGVGYLQHGDQTWRASLAHFVYSTIKCLKKQNGLSYWDFSSVANWQQTAWFSDLAKMASFVPSLPFPTTPPLSPLLLHPSSPPPLFVMRIVVLLCSPIFDWLTDWFKRRRLSIVIRERHKKEVMFKFYCKTDNRRLLFVKPHLKWPNTMNTFKEGRFYVERCNLTSLSFEVLI